MAKDPFDILYDSVVRLTENHNKLALKVEGINTRMKVLWAVAGTIGASVLTIAIKILFFMDKGGGD